MTLCTIKTIEFTICKSRKVQIIFGGGGITSDDGAILLNQADKIIGLTKRIVSNTNECRCKSKVNHSIGDMLRQMALPWVMKI